MEAVSPVLLAACSAEDPPAKRVSPALARCKAGCLLPDAVSDVGAEVPLDFCQAGTVRRAYRRTAAAHRLAGKSE